MTAFLDRVHTSYVYPRRLRRLGDELARVVPERVRVLDIGSGDGALAAALLERRPDLEIEGVDVLVRPETSIPTAAYDGKTLPHRDGAFDVALLVDVVHHAAAPLDLLAEARRVASRAVVLKDHLAEGPFSDRTLRMMDRIGNKRHGVALEYSFWTRTRWQGVFADLGLIATQWNERLRIYPWPASLVFDRSLHFMAVLERAEP